MTTCLYAIEFKDKTWKIGGSKNGIVRLKHYMGPCKPIFCVVQVVLQYNIHESKLIEILKKSLEWELSDGNEYFYPNIASEDAKKWIIKHFEMIDPNFPPFFGCKEDVISYLGKEENLMYLKDQENRRWEEFEAFKTNELSQMINRKQTLMTTYICEETSMTTYICDGCERSCPSANALRKHCERNHINGLWLCRIKKEKRSNNTKLKEAKTQVSELNPITVMEKVNDSSKTNELLQKLNDQMGELKEENVAMKEQNQEIIKQNEKIMNQNEEMKEMVTEFARNPKLLVLVDKLYQIQSLREIDLKMPAFKPVLEILDNELPEYANLAQEKTGKIHCKAVRKLNEIQPTTVKDEEKYRIRRSKISAKLLAAATPPYFARMVM